MNMYPQMQEWATSEIDRLTNSVRLARNAVRTAQRDLASIRNNRPTAACMKRYQEWREMTPPERLMTAIGIEMQPKERTQ
jgi:hypothetical protein